MSIVNEKFIVDLKGKQYVTYEGLLDLAHQKGLISINIELIQIPSKDNDMIAIAKATAKTKDKVFVDIGDAGPNSTNSMIRPHIIRMASTRAKARALRDLTNVGMTAIEELADEQEDNSTNNKESNMQRNNSSKRQGTKQDEDKQAIIDNSLASDKQLKYIYTLAKQKNYSDESMKKFIKSAYDKDSSKALTKAEASEMIKMLTDLVKEE